VVLAVGKFKYLIKLKYIVFFYPSKNLELETTTFIGIYINRNGQQPENKESEKVFNELKEAMKNYLE